MLLAAGANPNVSDNEGITPLHLCAQVRPRRLCFRMRGDGGHAQWVGCVTLY
jgi:hypothetical protein